MAAQFALPTPARWVAAGAGLAAAGYGAYAAWTWSRYGHPRVQRPGESDDLLDRFMPRYDIVERHHIAVDAPPDVTVATARNMNIADATLVRVIFSARELLLGATPDQRQLPVGLIQQVRALGWGVLAEVPGREIVMGAATKPWQANVTFRAVPPAEFRDFADADYVKIAWTLRADPCHDGASIFRTETRAVATDAEARRKFRPYWSLLSPGIIAIRHLMLAPLKRDAERARDGGRHHP